jgi:RNA polymerase sigma-70 factor (ECF subfamily)
MTGDEHLGQDLAQETFTRVYVRRIGYNGRGKFSTWLWRIALNLCHDELRRRKRRGGNPQGEAEGVDAVLADAADETHPAPDEATQKLEVVQLVQHALQRLPEAYRAVLVLRHYEGLKFREIADVLDVPEGTVKSRMAEALDRLHRLLRQATTDPSAAPSAADFQPLLVL